MLLMKQTVIYKNTEWVNLLLTVYITVINC